MGLVLHKQTAHKQGEKYSANICLSVLSAPKLSKCESAIPQIEHPENNPVDSLCSLFMCHSASHPNNQASQPFDNLK